MAAISSVFRLADRSPVRRRIVGIDEIPIVDTPLPPKALCEHPQFLAKGTGPWQRKVLSMRVGQSLIVTHRQADCFRSACRRLGIKTECRRLDEEHTQVQVA